MLNKQGGQNKRGGGIFVKFNKRGSQNKSGWKGGWGGVGISKNPLMLVMNEKIDINFWC